MLAIVSLFASALNAQWTDKGAFPDTSFTGSTHGIAVDPDGKIWWTSYYAQVEWIDGEDTLATSGIRVFNADGTEADFSPVVTVATGGGFVVDTLTGAARGLAADHEGNIIYVQSGTNKMFKINYQTGEGMARADLTEPGSSPTGPGIDANGIIYVGPVVGGDGTQIATYDSDLNYLGSAVDGPPDIARCLEVSDDGNTIYWTAFTGAQQMWIYNRADEFSPYALQDTVLKGMSIETARLNPATGHLWVSNDSRGLSYTSPTWFAYDPATKTLVDSFHYTPKVPDAADTYPRGIDFSPDGMTAYVGTFSNVQYGIMKFEKGAASFSRITFECDMSVQIAKGEFDAATGTMSLAGTLNGWDPAATPMLDDNADQVYDVTVDLSPGDTVKFKFVKNGDGWESVPDREYVVPFGADTFNAFFDDDDGKEKVEITLGFAVNMEFEIVSGRFNPASDTVSSRGNHNGWTGDTVLEPSVSDPNVYEGTQQFEVLPDDVIFFKYAYITASGTNWETNPPTGSGNYEYTITQADVDGLFADINEGNAPRYYNNATLETVVTQESTIRFVVDMNGATDGNGTAFPSLDNVVIAGANPPLAWPDGGWPDSDQDLVIFMFDDGTNGDETAGDGFWTKEVVFPQYSPLDIEYKYGANWGLASNNGANDNEGGVGNNHHALLFPSFWYGDTEDVFGVLESKDVVNSVEQIGVGVPEVYTLGQNYPNPFNPTTNINFSIPESGLVTLKVYNILGQQVVELVNDFKSAGTYEVNFDASDLTSGMYVYTIKAGNFTATKKMMLLK